MLSGNDTSFWLRLRLTRSVGVRFILCCLVGGLLLPASVAAKAPGPVAEDGLPAFIEAAAAPAATVTVEGTWLQGGDGSMQFWVAPPDQRILRRQYLPSSAPVSGEIQAYAARGEYEVFQLVVLPQTADVLQNASILAMSTDTGESLPASAFTFREVAYVAITEPTIGAVYDGEVPDPLPLFDSVQLTPDNQQALWVTIKVPDDAVAGTYTGELRLEFNQAADVSFPLSLHVWDFAIPEEHHLRTAYGMSAGRIYTYHNLDVDPAQRDQVLHMYIKSMAAHRISPNNPIGDNWYAVSFDNVNWLGGDYVPDPVITGETTNTVLLVDDQDTTRAVYAHSTVPVVVQYDQDYYLDIDVLMPAERIPDKLAYLVMIKQYDAGGTSIPGSHITFYKNAPQEEGWFTERLLIESNRWHADMSTLRITLFPCPWSETGVETGRMWFDNITLQAINDPLNLLANPDFNLVAPQDLQVSLYTPAMDAALEDIAAYGFDSLRLDLPFFAKSSVNSGLSQPSLFGWEWGTEEYRQAYIPIANAIETYLKSKGWQDRAYFYWVDEPPLSMEADLLYGMEILAEGAPSIDRLVTFNHPDDADPYLDAIDIWAPQYRYYQSDWAAQRRAAGDETWWYVSTGLNAPYPNNYIDYPGIDVRVRFWNAWKYGVQGSLYWSVNYWSNDLQCRHPQEQREALYCQDPWQDPQSYGPGDRRYGNGEGRLYYPPRGWQDAGGPILEEPVPSIRLELIREGLEDYEYFWLLQQFKNELDQKIPGHALVQQAEQYLQIPESLLRSLSDYSGSAVDYLEYRLEVARLIEDIQGAISGTPQPYEYFEDVPNDHWAADYINILAEHDYVAGCSVERPLFCPEQELTRAEMAVIIDRGNHTASLDPLEPASPPFSDVPLEAWFARWVQVLLDDGFTAGCSVESSELSLFCPLRAHTREEATVFFDRMLEGKDFIPPTPEPDAVPFYTDIVPGSWAENWILYAYDQGIVQLCEQPDQVTDALFRPVDALTRAEAACMMAFAQGWMVIE